MNLIYKDNIESFYEIKINDNQEKNRKIKIFGNGEERRDHIHIDNVAHIIRSIILKKYVGEINIVSGKTITFKSIAKKVVKNYSNS